MNDGEDDASDITIVDRLPPNVRLVRATAPGTTFNNATSGDLVWRISSLVFQEGGTITLVVKIGDTVPVNAVLQNTITISSDPPDTPRGNVETSSLVVGPHKRYLPITLR